MTCPDGRSCDWCGPAASAARKAAQAPTIADSEPVDAADTCDDYAPEDDYEADDDGTLHAEPLRVPLITRLA